jgi:HipA N-terminal domain
VTDELVALLDEKEVGRVQKDARGRLRFFYDDGWRKAADAYPLSLSMPLGSKEYNCQTILGRNSIRRSKRTSAARAGAFSVTCSR